MKPSSPPVPVASSAVNPASPPAAAGMESDWRPALARLEADLRRDIEVKRTPNESLAASSNTGATSDGALLRRVQKLIEESEQRQRQELALRLTQFTRDLEAQRRADLVRIEQGLGQFEGRTGAEVARQRQLLNYLVRVSGQVPE